MALNVNFTPPCLPLRHPPTLFPAHTILPSIKHTHHQNLIHSPSPPHPTASKLKASSKEVENAETPAVSELLDDETLNRISSVKEASEVLTIVADKSERNGGVVSSSDCGLIIRAALERNNAELAFSVYSAMRMSFIQGVSQTGSFTGRWKWARPDVRIYASLVKGLASSLRVSDAIRIIYDVCQIGIYSGDEVSFGKVVRCPSCMIAVAVVQPQHGTQIASCSKCRYQYEFVSGNIVTIESEQISMDIPAWERGLRFLSVMKQSIPAAVHSIVLPQRMVDVLAIKQQLLSQYDLLQTRIKDLREAAEKEVWMLARMCQLENKIVAVGEPSYRARRSRIKMVRESLESSLVGRIELIDSYARISSMIEIEVEMDSDVLAAESASNAEGIAEQIEQIMELENLEQRWKIQAEANDEMERLLSSLPVQAE